MIELNTSRLHDIACNDAAVAPLATLQAEALSAAADPVWAKRLPTFEGLGLADGVPLLNGHSIPVDTQKAARLLDRLAEVVEASVREEIRRLRRALADAVFDPLPLLQAGGVQDSGRLRELAGRLDVDQGVLSVLAQLGASPLLLACGRAVGALLVDMTWRAGFCPVCAAWPTLIEMRGLERQRWARCGRCGMEWRAEHHRCLYCGNDAHRSLGYLAAEAERESRRAETCDACRGYLKSFATLAALDVTQLIALDLTSVELDISALEQGYTRPERPGFELQVRLEPLRGDGRRR